MPEIQAPPTQAAGLFQKAHGKIVALQRLDSQLSALLNQRKRMHEELGEVQGQINTELLRVMHDSSELPGRILAEVGTFPSIEQNGAATETVA